MSELNETKKENTLQNHLAWLKGVGYLELGRAIAYAVCAVLVVVLSNGKKIAENVFSVTEADATNGMSVEALACTVGIVMAVLSLIITVLLFKSLKPGSKAAIAVEIITIISFVGTVIYIGTHDEVDIIFSTYTVSMFIDAVTIPAADYVRRHNK